ncbi:MAG: flagellar biosynthetic protein FliO [Desulfovibrio sp.]|uniref:flagellar biosynthetic protein FliO n=1 Tax=Desulfovibrio sp. 7SRBS1 TaxID=3378064 RepID=UPI003B3E33B5
MVNATATSLGQGSLLSQLFTVGGALFLLLAVLFAGFYLMRRFGPKAGLNGFSQKNLNMRLEGHMALGPRRSIMVVRLMDRRLVLGVCDHSINLLTELAVSPTDEPDGKDERKAKFFSQLLEKAGSSGDSH